MKFKKFLIIILSVALLSCFAVSTFATSATIPDYGFYISPGEYVFDEVLSNAPTMSFNFRFTNISDSNIFNSFQIYSASGGSNIGFYFRVLSDSQIVYNLQVASFSSGSFSWLNDDYRYITVLNGFYIYDIDMYQWWQSNITRVDSGYDNNLLDGILSSFTFIGEWISGAANAVTPMFWDGEALTVVGTLSVAGLSFAVVFLLIALVSSFMKFRS